MTNPPGEPPDERPSWSWEPSTTGARPPEEQQAEAGLPESPDPGEPVPGPGPPAEDAPEPVGDPVTMPPPPLDEEAPPPSPPPPPAANADHGEPPPSDRYPMRFDVAYPEGLSRWKTALRMFLIIPAWLFAWMVSQFISAALVIGWTTVFWRKKYPLWLFHGLSGAYEHSARVWSYGALLTDKFPSFSRDDSPVFLEYDEPPSGLLSRWRVLFWKWLLLIPTFIVLSFLALAVFVVTVLAWFAILFTGNYPRGMFQFSVGVQRWYFRVVGYLASFNDRYPPYALSDDAGAANPSTVVASGIGGLLLGGGFAALITVAAIVGGRPETQDVDYDALVAGRAAEPMFFEPEGFNDDGFIGIVLNRAIDPGEGLVPILAPARGERVVVFEWRIFNASDGSASIAADAARLRFEYEDEDGEERRRSTGAEIVTVGNRAAPADIGSGDEALLYAVFVVPEDAEPISLRLTDGFVGVGGIRYDFD